MDLGQSQRDVDVVPSTIRYANLPARLEHPGNTVLDEANSRVREPSRNQRML